MVSDPSTLLWGGRFTENMNDLMVTFNESLPFDKALHEADVRGSITYAKALLQLDLLTDEELSEITTGLEAVEKEWADGKFVIHPAVDEDIHTANERRLAELIGPTIAGKLHTGRSRNEQIATDLRLRVRAQLDGLSEQLRAALTVCAARAKAGVDVLMPGYTHFQRAQPVRFSH
ncbi:argininosuccinate lyase [Fusarium oxysporum f. sp. melonis 26406]|uniref:argininosuccinate lyase n=1 Tax=Fusarium oxysporum f. sp. melonis 26406 TaxID=1089452 RepID=X0A3U0_FUSOX|nr:argininosuccinate lyase [Fusarium oxysporum f. sp. melonis 26406]